MLLDPAHKNFHHSLCWSTLILQACRTLYLRAFSQPNQEQASCSLGTALSQRQTGVKGKISYLTSPTDEIILWSTIRGFESQLPTVATIITHSFLAFFPYSFTSLSTMI